MNDCELLELAAKAADIEIRAGSFKDLPYGLILAHHPSGMPTFWNPLINDGDALSLAVKLGMQIDTRSPETHVYAAGAGERVDEYHTGNEPLRATRRAIVRAAAKIGSSMPD